MKSEAAARRCTGSHFDLGLVYLFGSTVVFESELAPQTAIARVWDSADEILIGSITSSAFGISSPMGVDLRNPCRPAVNKRILRQPYDWVDVS